ncbi:MAG: hypothetical protein ACD_37C00126G0004 [uncultured bacterium]|nr:MAG: hypothetical protein ACD_37C00126G0004 [uncultured bacterium]
MALERLTVEDQVANAHLYQVWDREGVDDGWYSQIKDFNFTTLLRIEDLTQNPLRGTSVLDVGCGTGDFFPNLREAGVGEYLGIDVLSPSIEKARTKYPDGAFRQGDFLVEPYGEKFDFAFLSGALTTALPSDNTAFMMRMLARMGQVTNSGFAFNYLTGTKQKLEGVHLTHFYSRELVALLCDELFPNADRFVIPSQLGPTMQDTVFIVKKPLPAASI